MKQTPSPEWTRRQWLLASGAGLGGLIVGCGQPSALSRGDSAEGAHPLNAWVSIHTDGATTIWVPRSEMGQGIYTSLAQLVAEELDARWDFIRVKQAPAARVYANTALLTNILPLQPDDEGTVARAARWTVQTLSKGLSLNITGGSSSVRAAWEPMRLAGAAARTLLVQAAAQRWSVPASECQTREGEVVHSPSGRRLPYGELAPAAAKLNAPSELSLRPASEWRLIGQSPRRLDTPEKIQGRAAFGLDYREADMLFASVRQCPLLGGHVQKFDESSAQHISGVVKAVQLDEHCVAVVAHSSWAALKGARELQVQWAPGFHEQLDSAQIQQQLWQALDEHKPTRFRKIGEALAELDNTQAGQRIVRADYEVPFLAHAAMEPLNATARWNPPVAEKAQAGRLSLWCGTQSPTLARLKAAQLADIDMDAVDLHIPFLGGGFGRRLETDVVEQVTRLALMFPGRAVQLLWSREEDMQHDFYRPAAVSRLSAKLDAQGRVRAWHHRVAAPSVSHETTLRILPHSLTEHLPMMPDKVQIEGAFDLPYAIEHQQVDQVLSATPVPVGSWRSVGHSYNAFFTECFLDELAHASGQDPLAYRQAMLTQRPRHQAVLNKVAQISDWKSPRKGAALGIALHESFGSICAQVAEVVREGSTPRVTRVWCVIDCGTAIHPDGIVAQMESAVAFGLSAALQGRITVAHGQIQQSGFADYPVVRMRDMPQVKVEIMPSSAPPGGVGEPGTPPVAPAVANAWFALTGQRLRSLPLMPA